MQKQTKTAAGELVEREETVLVGEPIRLSRDAPVRPLSIRIAHEPRSI